MWVTARTSNPASLHRLVRRRWAVLGALWLWPVAALTAAEPARIVSMNVCTDQLVLTLVEPERVASVSYLAADPRTSGIADRVQALHLNHGVAEEIVALKPDLVVTANFGFRPTVAVLRTLGYPILELHMAESFADIKANLRALGKAVGEGTRAEQIITTMDEQLGLLSYRGDRTPPLFVKYDVNGWTTGQNSLITEIVHRAGFHTPGDRLGLTDARRLSLEQLLELNPPLIALGAPWDDPPALASESFRHPALAALLKRSRVIHVAEPLWICGTPRSLEVLELLRSEHDVLMGNGGNRPR